MSKRAKIIAMVQLPPPMHGAAKMNRHAIDALSRVFDLHVIEMHFSKDLSDIGRPTFGKVFHAIWLALRLICALPASRAFYICFAPRGAAYYRDSLYVLITKLFQVPAIIHLHGRGLPAMRQTRFSAWFQKGVFSDQTVILLGETLRSEITGLNCASTIIANCLDDDAFAKPVSEHWKPRIPLRILWLSNLFRAKGLETLLAACALLDNQDVAFELTIAGAAGDINPPMLRELLHSYGIDANTRYIGPATAHERKILFRSTDLFVFPTNYANEAQPLVVLEAMAAGIPVITSGIATLPEFVIHGQTGWLCRPNSPENLAQTIIDVTRSADTTHQVRVNARSVCETRFTRDRFTKEIISTIRNAMR
ncbi:glycosyltransferase family 4 protein [Thalassospira sp. SM2505]|uniref:Glycosyl transferase family 1 domain-containing protein n=1 Tax=Thalassospira profundimaris TaxID=502049 RepID=A0A367WUL7_9PROT|nr:glycosyltransferase family 4 protein [Thalassospira profundimaris]RCK45077.1 hypothetical protein TH30_13815 [Thalassospira profundimaris]